MSMSLDSYSDEYDSPVIESPTAATSAEENEKKLRVANRALRKQLKSFSKALADLQEREPFYEREEMEKEMLNIAKKLSSAEKKLLIYKRANKELKSRLHQSVDVSRVATLQELNEQQAKRIAMLVRENKELTRKQRKTERAMDDAEHRQEEWPSKLRSLMEDIRVYRDRFRKLKVKEMEAKKQAKEMHVHLIQVQNSNKQLKEVLRQQEQGKSPEKDKIQSLKSGWASEKEKLEKSIETLQKSKEQERAKLEKCLKDAKLNVEQLKNKLQEEQSQGKEKEQAIRAQIVQVRKLKQELRDLAIEGAAKTQSPRAPLPTSGRPAKSPRKR